MVIVAAKDNKILGFFVLEESRHRLRHGYRALAGHARRFARIV
jgi:hypothetical protein